MPNSQNSVTRKLGQLVAGGELRSDPGQMEIAGLFDRLLNDIYATETPQKSSPLGWLFAKRKPAPIVKGLYIHGGVGRGKTMLMDLLFDLVPIKAKRRAHFHAFMADVHERIHRHRQRLKNGETKEADPVPPVAQSLMAEARLLCFDEFSVTDIADAMILSRLFGELFSRGCILVATSNVEPDNLYRDGLNRSLFLPFVDMLKQYVNIVPLDSVTDYRLEKTGAQPIWRYPLNDQTRAALDADWNRAAQGRPAESAAVERKGRSIPVPRASGHAARFSFSDLCERPLGASDYLAILDRYQTIFIEGIPYLGREKRNETKRFITLIDTLYDRGAKLYATAVAAPENLLTDRHSTEGFEFDRTVSRLIEMQSEDYAPAAKEP